MGLAVSSVKLGLCSFATAKRKHKKSEPEHVLPKGTAVHLGPHGSSYILHDNFETAIRTAERILQEAGPISWPATPEEVPEFMGKVVAFAEVAYTVYDDEGGKGFEAGPSGHLSYCAKHFARGVLYTLEEMFSGLLDALTMDDIAVWTPDEDSYLAAVSGMSVSGVREMFGVSPILLRMWLCMVDSVDEAGKQRLLHSTDEQLLSIWHKHDVDKHSLKNSADPVVALGPHDLAELLQCES